MVNKSVSFLKTFLITVWCVCLMKQLADKENYCKNKQTHTLGAMWISGEQSFKYWRINIGNEVTHSLTGHFIRYTLLVPS